DIKGFQVVVTEACNLIQLKNQPDISDSSDLTETNRLSITRRENRALDECGGELGASTVMRKTGYADNHRAMRCRKNRVRGTRRGNRKKRGFHLAIDALSKASRGYCLQHPKADDNGSTLHSRSTMGPITDRSHFAEAFLPVKYVRNVRCSNVSNGKMPYVDVTPIVNGFRMQGVYAVDKAPQMFRDWPP
ncbi:hypothetical protein ALC57_17689, partial [Trachymyrmex cornetzi]